MTTVVVTAEYLSRLAADPRFHWMSSLAPIRVELVGQPVVKRQCCGRKAVTAKRASATAVTQSAAHRRFLPELAQLKEQLKIDTLVIRVGSPRTL